MSPRARNLFLLLILAQALHSVEEYHFRLFDRLAPARFIADAVGFDRPLGFAIANIALVAFGLWCWIARVGPGRRSARAFAWFWALLECANGLAHVALAAAAGGYFPGLATAPLLLGLGLSLIVLLVRRNAP
ncbi:MAG TPA: HXXEE domain-containing protein [Allosphingosinicella sp.]